MDKNTIILEEFVTISIGAAIAMREEAIRIANKMGVSGFLVIFDRSGMQLCSQAVGAYAKQMAVQIALAKAETVSMRRQSTKIWNDFIQSKKTRPENYAGVVKTLFGGGLAIFVDEGCTEFVGAIAFSGGEESQDREICQEAIAEVGLYTDDND